MSSICRTNEPVEVKTCSRGARTSGERCSNPRNGKDRYCSDCRKVSNAEGNAKRKETMKQLKSQVEILTKRETTLQTQVDDLTNKETTLQSQVRVLSKKETTLQSQVDDLLSQVDDLTKKKTTLRSQVKKAKGLNEQHFNDMMAALSL
ncbi:MAG: hypothetical protein J3R72DRAFT_476491 [Linnemannia gamsii]|nr:MAG: hypothetical protein J3R72DRAFT_476491 [Linnemannia gamsii]